MGKKDPRVEAYIAKSAAFAQPILRRIRQAVHAGCPQVEETIKWGMPHFVHGGRNLCGAAAFKKHCALFFWGGKPLRDELKNFAEGQRAMGRLRRIESLADLPASSLLKQFVQCAARVIEMPRPPKAKAGPKRKIVVRVPADLQAALAKNKQAGATFERFSPSRRRDYVEWIVEAKRDETRQKRLKTTIEWLAEGKARNWKYEK